MPKRKTVEIDVNDDFELPSTYSVSSPETNGEILTLGAFLYEQMNTHRSSEVVKKIEKQREQEQIQYREQILQIKKEAAAKQTELEKQISEIEAMSIMKQYQLLEAQKARDAAIHKGETDDLVKQHNANLRSLQAENATLESQKHALEARCAQITMNRDNDIDNAIERNNQVWTSRLEDKENTISLLRGMLDGNINTLSENFAKFYEENLKRSLNSRNKGAEYENFMASKLKQCYGSNQTFSLEEKSKSSSGHEADIIMNWNDKSVLWEAKNYTNPVGKEQIDKFHRDMRENPYIKVGIMMSRFTTITGKAKRGDFFTELVGDQLHIYVSNADTFGDSLFQLLPHLWTAHWEAISKNVRQEDEELERALRGIDKLIERISKRKTEWVGIKSSLMKGINWMNDEIDTDEIELKKIFRVLKSGEKEKPLDAQWVSLINEQDNDEFNDLITIIKRICIPENNSIIKLNDLKKNIHNAWNEPKPSEDTIKKRLKNILSPTIIINQPGKDTMVNGIKFNLG